MNILCKEWPQVRKWSKTQKLTLAGIVISALALLLSLINSCRPQKIEIADLKSTMSILMDSMNASRYHYLYLSTNQIDVSRHNFNRVAVDSYTEQELEVWAKSFYDKHQFDVAFSLCKHLALKGNAVAQYNLAGMYYFGQGVLKNDREYFLWCRKSADQGLPEAQFDLGIAYFRAIGTDRNLSRSRQCFIDSANGGYARAQSLLGFLYMFGERFGLKTNYNEAFSYMQKAAAQDFPMAYFQIGWMYMFGLGCEPNVEMANEYFNKAYVNGDDGVRAITKQMTDALKKYEKEHK